MLLTHYSDQQEIEVGGNPSLFQSYKSCLAFSPENQRYQSPDNDRNFSFSISIPESKILHVDNINRVLDVDNLDPLKRTVKDMRFPGGPFDDKTDMSLILLLTNQLDIDSLLQFDKDVDIIDATLMLERFQGLLAFRLGYLACCIDDMQGNEAYIVPISEEVISLTPTSHE